MNAKDGSRRDQDARIRDRAYEIWISEGRPEGRDSEHWEQARSELLMDQSETSSRSSSRSPAVKAVDGKSATEKKNKSAPKPAKPRAAPKSGGLKHKGKSTAAPE